MNRRARLRNTGSTGENAARELTLDVLLEARRFTQIARKMRDVEPFPDTRAWMRGYAFAAKDLALSIRETIRWHARS